MTSKSDKRGFNGAPRFKTALEGDFDIVVETSVLADFCFPRMKAMQLQIYSEEGSILTSKLDEREK